MAKKLPDNHWFASHQQLVDATNFVLFELGQPLHSFDADKIKGGKVIVRQMPEGTPFVTLDGVERKLSSEDLMICNAEEPMCIGGVFGGLDSGVTASTQNVFLESAYFNPVYIRKTARRHGLNTDASFRFERGCDPNNTIYALKRCALLIQEIAGGEIASEIVDVYPQKILPFEVPITISKINSLIGKNLERATILTILSALEIEIKSAAEEEFLLEVPTYRVDVRRDVDVIEDILRIYGYNNIEIGEKLISTLSNRPKPDTFHIQNMISEQLTAQGFNEVMNNSLTKRNYYASSSTLHLDKCVKIMNPLSSDLSVMRQTLLFGGLENIVYNNNRKIFDIKFMNWKTLFYHRKQNSSIHYGIFGRISFGLCCRGNKHSQSWTSAEEKSSIF
jgi:phenylalanyl-tRNA synthetase beta chain